MSRVITFSRQFPQYHEKAGQPTLFVERFWQSVQPNYDSLSNELLTEKRRWRLGVDWDRLPKHHTIRGGNRWKVGDKFSPRVWSGRPYNSPQIIIAPDVEIKKVWDIKIVCTQETDNGFHNYWYLNGDFLTFKTIDEIAKNDGLNRQDLLHWFKDDEEFPKPLNFTGQIICWNDSVKYNVA